MVEASLTRRLLLGSRDASAAFPPLGEGFVSQTPRCSPLHRRDKALPASGRRFEPRGDSRGPSAPRLLRGACGIAASGRLGSPSCRAHVAEGSDTLLDGLSLNFEPLLEGKKQPEYAARAQFRGVFPQEPR